MDFSVKRAHYERVFEQLANLPLEAIRRLRDVANGAPLERINGLPKSHRDTCYEFLFLASDVEDLNEPSEILILIALKQIIEGKKDWNYLKDYMILVEQEIPELWELPPQEKRFKEVEYIYTEPEENKED